MGTNAITDVLTAPQLVTLAVVLVFILPIGIFMQRRWNAWHDRTYELYGLIEKALGTHFTYDRTGKLADLLLKGGDAPGVLRIRQPGGIVRAMIIPRIFWIWAAEIRLDLEVAKADNRKTRYFLFSKLRRDATIDDEMWYIAERAAPLHRQPLTEEILRGIMMYGSISKPRFDGRDPAKPRRNVVIAPLVADVACGSDSTVRRCGRHVRSTLDRDRMLQRGLRASGQ